VELRAELARVRELARCVKPAEAEGRMRAIEGYSGSRLVMRSLFLVAECHNNKDDLFMKGFSYHTSS
jgi:hypothetical protein